jgi:hypothetical protein
MVNGGGGTLGSSAPKGTVSERDQKAEQLFLTIADLIN